MVWEKSYACPYGSNPSARIWASRSWRWCNISSSKANEAPQSFHCRRRTCKRYLRTKTSRRWSRVRKNFTDSALSKSFSMRSVIEVLAPLLRAAGDHRQRLLVLNAIIVNRNLSDLVIGIEECQNQSSRFHHAQ